MRNIKEYLRSIECNFIRLIYQFKYKNGMEKNTLKCLHIFCFY